MQRFVLTFFFVILGLGQVQAYDQQNPNPTNSSTPTVAEKDKGPAHEGDSETDKTKGQSDKKSPALIIDDKMKGKEVSVLSSVDKIAKKANFWSMWQTIFSGGTLLLAAAATWFARGAWKVGKEGVEVTKDIGQKQVRAYLGFESAEWWADSTVTFLNVTIKNFGQSPCKIGVMTSVMSMRRFIIDLKEGKIIEDDKIFSGKRKTPIGVIEAGGTTDLLTAFSFTDGDEKWIYTSVDPDTEVEFDILIEWTDVFDDTSEIYFSCHIDGSHKKHQESSDRYEKLRIIRTDAEK